MGANLASSHGFVRQDLCSRAKSFTRRHILPGTSDLSTKDCAQVGQFGHDLKVWEQTERHCCVPNAKGGDM
jgi:hypothetical protein